MVLESTSTDDERLVCCYFGQQHHIWLSHRERSFLRRQAWRRHALHQLDCMFATFLNQQLAFDYAVISNDLGEETSDPNRLRQHEHYCSRVQWELDCQEYDRNSELDRYLPYHRTTELGSSVAMNFTGGVGVAVNGTRNWGGWVYNVTLDGVSYQYNASTMWLIDDALLFYTTDWTWTRPTLWNWSTRQAMGCSST
ncbi:hypothetical protein B0H21DRAFT_129923 [Amylocystis lapponica]|nr:hypothetical protein B0H21DRAFT_129923 [Amylocystis lapponica]